MMMGGVRLPKSYVTIAGESLPTIALEAYGDEYLSHLIAAANPSFADVIIFDDGISLVIPDLEVNDSEAPPWRR